jgi:hypothetical protein
MQLLSHKNEPEIHHILVSSDVNIISAISSVVAFRSNGAGGKA